MASVAGSLVMVTTNWPRVLPSLPVEIPLEAWIRPLSRWISALPMGFPFPTIATLQLPPFHLLCARELGFAFGDVSAQHLAVEEDPGTDHEIEGAGSQLHPAPLKEQCPEFLIAHLVRRAPELLCNQPDSSHIGPDGVLGIAPKGEFIDRFLP